MQQPRTQRISPVRNDAGQVIGASRIARDISDRRKMAAHLIQAEKLAATGRMASAIANEINNPLASVMNLICLARQENVTKCEIQGYLNIAETELERVAHIVRQTLGYYRDTGSPRDVHLHALMEDVLSIFKSKLRTYGIDVDCKFGDLRGIKVRAGEVIQIFSNLVSNAIDSMPKGGKLSITIAPTMKADSEGIQTAISDTGHGIARDDLGKVFEPFLQRRVPSAWV